MDSSAAGTRGPDHLQPDCGALRKTFPGPEWPHRSRPSSPGHYGLSELISAVIMVPADGPWDLAVPSK